MYRIGIDLGGTNIAVGIVDEQYRLIAQISVPTGAHRPWQEVVVDMCDAVESVLQKANISLAECQSIGVGSPGACDSEAGVVVRAYNLQWFNVPVCKTIQDRLGLPAYLSNDANCAALAETVAGNAIGCRNMILITLGTGVGGGIVIDGKIYGGMRSMGGELGHIVLMLDGKPCTCGRKGCWEAYASVTALIQQAKAAAAEHPESVLHTAAEMTGKTVFDAADAGDIQAKKVIDRWCEYIAAGLTDMVNSLAPERILIGGGVSCQGEKILRPIREYVTANCFGGKEGAVPIIDVARLHGEAGIVGAAALG